jgi:hypothetical protein
MDHEAGGKESAFTWEMGELILRRMADRETMKTITADPRMPAYCTVFRWVQMVPEFGAAYRDLRMWLAEVSRAEAVTLRRLRGQLTAFQRADRAAATGRPVRTRVSGRKSSYTPKLARAVCAQIAGGASMSEVVAQPGMPSSKVVYTWLRTRPNFRADYIEACATRALELAVQVQIAVDTVTPQTFAAARERVRALRARAGRLAPKLYRPRLPLDW